MSLKANLQNDLIAAMKTGDQLKVGVLRMVKASLMKFEVSGDKKKDATDEEVLGIIAKEMKQRKEAADAFAKGGRQDLADKELKEAAVIASYLPAQMNEKEVHALAQEAISHVGAASAADLGKVMAVLMPKVKGRADGQMVNIIVKELLK